MIIAFAILMQAAGPGPGQPATAPTAPSAPVAAAAPAPEQFRKKCRSVHASYSRTLRRVCENIPIVPAAAEPPPKPVDPAR